MSTLYTHRFTSHPQIPLKTESCLDQATSQNLILDWNHIKPDFTRHIITIIWRCLLVRIAPKTLTGCDCQPRPESTSRGRQWRSHNGADSSSEKKNPADWVRVETKSSFRACCTTRAAVCCNDMTSHTTLDEAFSRLHCWATSHLATF